MRLAGWGAHLGYCTNIHPGESWEEVFDNLQRHVVGVKRTVAPDRAFGVGLRLGAAAAAALTDDALREELRAWLADEGLYVFTVNGFPYGQFHGTRVKEAVYRPDWLEDERVSYSSALAAILADLLPADLFSGTVSTVPGAFKPRVTTPEAEIAMAARIGAHAADLVHIHEETGKRIRLALEPEPFCHLETVAETVSFFEERLFHADNVRRFGDQAGLSGARAEEALRDHVGVCLDACHMAVEFEDPAAALERFERAGILVPKVQLSAGLEVDPSAESLQALRRFADDVYLHQVVVESPSGLERYLDLDDALGAAPDGLWRVHFHVPLFREALGPFRATQRYVAELLALLAREGPRDLEVETYTWDVLPEEHRQLEVGAAVARELEWVLDQLREGAA